jgi:hypothetical protein
LTRISVENEEQAIKIANTYVMKKNNNNFIDYEIHVCSGEEYSIKKKKKYWVVSYIKVEGIVFGGGGLEVRIRKSDGKVVYCMFQM